MRYVMTIPFLVMLISLAIWFLMVKFQKFSDAWLVEVCRIVFTVSALVVLWGMMNKVAF